MDNDVSLITIRMYVGTNGQISDAVYVYTYMRRFIYIYIHSEPLIYTRMYEPLI